MSKRYNPFASGDLSALVKAARALHETMALLVDDDGFRPVQELIEQAHPVMWS
jgi:hypothetical protein